jgi:hypothetical protein
LGSINLDVGIDEVGVRTLGIAVAGLAGVVGVGPRGFVVLGSSAGVVGLVGDLVGRQG